MATQKNSKSKATASKAKPSKAAPAKKTASKAKPAPGKARVSGKAQPSKGKKTAPVSKAKQASRVSAKAPVKKKVPAKAASKGNKPGASKSKLSKAKPTLKKPSVKPVAKTKAPVIPKSSKSVSKAPVKAAPSKAVPSKATPVKAAPVVAKKPATPVRAELKTKAPELRKPQPKTLPAKQPAMVQTKAPVKATGSKMTDVATKPSVSSKTVVDKPKPINVHTVKPIEKMSDKKENKPVSATAIAEEPQKTRYNDKELEEFDQLIDQKLIVAREQLEFYLKQLEDMAENPDNKIKGLDDGLSTLESERVSSMAARQQKLIQHLENAKIRIKNKVYGICRETGKLISKERLRAVPHATLSIEAKQAQN